MTGIRHLSRTVLGALLLAAPFSVAADAEPSEPPAEVFAAQVIFLGEQHDNRGHHEVQALWTLKLAPRAIVFEMLTADQAAKITPENRQDETMLEQALAWEASGWPDFSMYYPIFAAAPKAEIYGAGVPRDQLRDLMAEDLADVVGAETVARFALDQPLPASEQTIREDLQRTAHCDALPEELLPRMVSVQRLRDANLAQVALQALETHGPPVVVITGNGHAREDWGAPFLLRQAAPEVAVFTLGQGEAGRMPEGGFAFVVDGASVDRGDPCAAFN
ncbi:ChaN family lipoprotein [Roseobacter weihaiensis]|uniref:ChaN family lipoprotein n=1 Tax=Roseobacter weihaiensis TaxID=2763262 RepID=UPI0029CABC07|nr:ChaN family lipoprotein [Roseobacter sp. H9]